MWFLTRDFTVGLIITTFYRCYNVGHQGLHHTISGRDGQGTHGHDGGVVWVDRLRCSITVGQYAGQLGTCRCGHVVSLRYDMIYIPGQTWWWGNPNRVSFGSWNLSVKRKREWDSLLIDWMMELVTMTEAILYLGQIIGLINLTFAYTKEWLKHLIQNILQVENFQTPFLSNLRSVFSKFWG